MSRYVQHISGEGERFLVLVEAVDRWDVKAGPNRVHFCLPKSDYRECPPRWVDVTQECELYEGADGETSQIRGKGMQAIGYIVQGYRLRKVRAWLDGTELGHSIKIPQYSFTVEKKEDA